MKRLLNVDIFHILDFLRPMKVTALDLNFDTQLGPDHNIHVVPGVSKSFFIYRSCCEWWSTNARREPAVCSSHGSVALAA